MSAVIAALYTEGRVVEIWPFFISVCNLQTTGIYIQNQHMKYTFLVLASLCFSALTYAQTTNGNDGKTKLKVTLSKESLSAVYNNQPVPISSIQSLDSLIKKIADPHLEVEFESINAMPEKNRSVKDVLKKCQCHIISRSLQKRDFN